MAAGLMLLYIILQIALGLVFVLWLWLVRLRNASQRSQGRRERLLWIATVAFTLGVVLDYYFMFARHVTSHKFPALASFGMGCIGSLFGFLGKGRGRIVTTLASAALAVSWLPFILP
jgi:hypothetical protein